MTSSDLPQPDEKIQPIRVLAQRDQFVEEAEAVGIENLVEFRAFYTRDVLLYGALAGPEDGIPVVLLHGFPDFWLGWSRQVRALVDAGARVIIPDQRGYNLSEKPADVDAYRLVELGQDVIDLLDAAGIQQAHVVGHDWGGGVSWWLAEHRPERLETVTIMNCPRPEVIGEALQLKHLRQMLKSWYIGLFQIPKVPELLAGIGDFALFEAALKSASPQAFGQRELQLYRRAWGRDGARTAMFNWYRAAARQTLERRKEESRAGESSITVPLQIIWGKNDVALDASLVEPSADIADEVNIHWFDDATHWVHRDEPEAVNELLVEFIRR